MNTKALEDLYELMNNFPEDHKFNMDLWVSREDVTTEAQAVECGTACCAAGWGCLMLDSWKALGLSAGLYYLKNAEGNPGYSALEHSLEISYHEALYIFSPDHYLENPPPTAVAARIREVLDA